MEYKILMNCGIGDCMVYKSQLIKLISKYPDIKIFISPNESIINRFGVKADKYRSFIYEFCRFVFREENFILTSDQTYPLINPMSLYKNHGLIPSFVDLSDKITSKNSIESDDYIIVHTKVKGFIESNFREVNSKFIDFIKDIQTSKIVLMGERKKTYIDDDISLSHYTFNIYEEMLKVFKDKIIDLTMPDYENTPVPTVENIMNDSNIINKAKNNIVLGWGGNFHLASCFGKMSNIIDLELTEACGWHTAVNGCFSLYYEKDVSKFSTGCFENFKKNITYKIT